MLSIGQTIQGGSNMTGTDLYVKIRTAQQLCDLERVKLQPPPSLLLGLEPLQSCLGVARVMSEQKTSRPLKFTTDSNNSMGKSVSVGDTLSQLLRSAACLHTNQSRSYLNHLVLRNMIVTRLSFPEDSESISWPADQLSRLFCVHSQSLQGTKGVSK